MGARIPAVAVVAALVATAPLGAALPVPALPVPLVLALPGGWLVGYTTQAMATAQGGSLTFLNLDIFDHDVVAFNTYGPDDQPWCGPGTLHPFPGQCPLFASELIGTGSSAPVLGLENLVPGSLYSYYCTLHPTMRGTLVALPGVPA